MSTNPDEKTGLDKAIESALTDLDNYHAEEEEYQKAVDQLAKLHAMKMAENSNYVDELVKIQSMHNESRPSRVSPDTLALVAGNLLGIIMIVGHERMHIVSSKALGFLGKLR